MKRVAIIGPGGAGKSTLARGLGALLDLPVVHLDQLYWGPGWVETARNDWLVLQQDLVRRPSWIVDGNYGGTMDLRLEAADTIVFLNPSRYVCLTGVLKRRLRGRSKGDEIEGCPERTTWEFVTWIWDYPKSRSPRILEKLKRLSDHKEIVILSSRREARSWLERVALTGKQ